MTKTATATATATATCQFDLELLNVPPGMPPTLQLRMLFYPSMGVVEDTFPLWKTAHAQEGACDAMKPDVAHALGLLAREALHSSQVRDMMVDFVDEHGAHDVDTPGTMTLTLDLRSDTTRVGLPCDAVLQLEMEM